MVNISYESVAKWLDNLNKSIDQNRIYISWCLLCVPGCDDLLVYEDILPSIYVWYATCHLRLRRELHE